MTHILKDDGDCKKAFETQSELLKHTREELEALKAEQDRTRANEQEFLQNMTRELLSSLNSIQILSNLLVENKEGKLGSKQLNYAQIIADAGKQMHSVLNDVQDLARIMAGKLPTHSEDITIKRFGTYISQNFEQDCRNKGLTLQLGIAETVPEKIVTDRSAVEKILRNLISNAIKFTEQGSITVAFDISESKNGEEALVISVQDTGIGIPENQKDMIFEAFRAYDRRLDRSLTGVGLGLSISRAVAGILGGEIRLESEEGTGSTFQLLLPLRSENGRYGSDSENTATGKRIPQSIDMVNKIRDDRHDWDSSEPAILIVEDDPNFARILFEITRENGFKCLLAEDGEAGLQMASQYRPGAIILDLGLPRIDGISVLKKLKMNPLTHSIPVYVISGFDKRHTAIGQGAVGYLTKPVNMQAVSGAFSRLKTLIENGSQPILLWNHDLEAGGPVLNHLRKYAYPHTVVSELYDLKEMVHNGRGRCIVTDSPIEHESMKRLFQAMNEDALLADIPVILTNTDQRPVPETDAFQQNNERLVILRSAGEETFDRLLKRFMTSKAPDDANAGRQLLPGDLETDLFRGKTVLLADSDKKNLFALSSILEEKEIRMMTACSVEQLVQALSQDRAIDLIMVRMEWAETDGEALLGQIRKQPGMDTIPVIALSARAIKGDRRRFIAAGATEYLSMPVIPEKLDAILQVWLSG